MSGSRFPRLRPLAETPGALGADAAPAPCGGLSPAELIEAELKAFCRSGELVYAAIVDPQRGVEHAICMVGSRPHNEARIGELVSQAFATAKALGREIGESAPAGLTVHGSRWGYSLDLLEDGRILCGIFPSQALPAIVRACAQRTRAALRIVLGGTK